MIPSLSTQWGKSVHLCAFGVSTSSIPLRLIMVEVSGTKYEFTKVHFTIKVKGLLHGKGD